MAKRRSKRLYVTGEDLTSRWKTHAGAMIWAFAKSHSPLKGKLTGRYLYIDSDSISDALILEGIVPEASMIKGWRAPLNKYVPARPHPVKLFYGGWKTIKKKRGLTKSPGVGIRNVEYYGGKRPTLGYFGMKQDGELRAYGLTSDSNALPVYSNQSVVEWLCDENMSEVQRILRETFDKVMKRRKTYS